MRQFESEHIIYREMTLDDTENVLSWRNSEEVVKNFFYKSYITKEEHENYYHNFIKTGKSLQFVMADKKTGDEFGCVYFSHIDNINHTGEYGVFIGNEKYRGIGYGNEAAKSAVIYGFGEMGFERIDARVKVDNYPSLACFEKAGYTINEELKMKSDYSGDLDEVVFLSIYPEGETIK